jgi:hypothetical protein
LIISGQSSATNQKFYQGLRSVLELSLIEHSWFSIPTESPNEMPSRLINLTIFFYAQRLISLCFKMASCAAASGWEQK